MGAFRIKRGIFAVAFLQVQYREKDFLVRELYVTTISCVCAAILFGLFGAGLALHNTSGNPKEAICHYPGKESIHLPLTGQAIDVAASADMYESYEGQGIAVAGTGSTCVFGGAFRNGNRAAYRILVLSKFHGILGNMLP